MGRVGKGQARVEDLKARGFGNANLYGENQVGGLGRLYVLAEKPAAYGLPEAPTYPALADVWQSIAQPLGGFALGATVLGVIAAFFITRRNIRMEEVE